MSAAQWDALQIPVNMAFFCTESGSGRVAAFYPSPMGPTQSQLPLAAWADLSGANPVLRQLQPDVEALLVDRRAGDSHCFIAPVDACYRLVGLIRMHWTGIGGGAVVQMEIARFFQELRLSAQEAANG